VAFIDALPALDEIEITDSEEQVGIEIIRKSLAAPMRVIADNAGFEGTVVVEKVKTLSAGEGLNSVTGEYGDMIKMGIIDPVKVTRSALQNAASVAALILITEATVADIPKEGLDPAALAGMMGGGGGGMY
jgi:chaperonin GroEL